MIKPAALLVGARVEEAQGVERAFPCLRFVDPVPISGNAERRQSKTGGRNAGDVLVTCRQRFSIHARPIGYESCVGISLLPEVLKRAALQIIEKRVPRLRLNTNKNQQEPQKSTSASKNIFCDSCAFLWPTKAFINLSLLRILRRVTSTEFAPTITRNSPGSTT